MYRMKIDKRGMNPYKSGLGSRQIFFRLRLLTFFFKRLRLRILIFFQSGSGSGSWFFFQAAPAPRSQKHPAPAPKPCYKYIFFSLNEREKRFIPSRFSPQITMNNKNTTTTKTTMIAL